MSQTTQATSKLRQRMIEDMRMRKLCDKTQGSYILDALGGWLDDDQFRRRDAAVFRICRAIGLPVAWNLAGGYRRDFRKVLDVHDASLQECARVWL
jgi:hypothetical protein